MLPLPLAVPSPLSVSLLGGCVIEVHGVPMRKLRTRQGNRLLALLALSQGRDLERAVLIGQLWPDSQSDTVALATLRRTLTDLRDALGVEAGRLSSRTRFTLGLDLSGGAFYDIAAFDRAIAEGSKEDLDKAIDLYRGPLMPDLDTVYDPEGTLQNERERLHFAFLDTLQRRAERRRANHDFEGAIADLRRLLTADPTREKASRMLMEILAFEVEDCAGALAEYVRLQRELSRAFNIRPEEATHVLHGRIEANQAQAAVRSGSEPSPRVAAIANNLPVRLTRFIGRESAVEAVQKLLCDNRLLTLTGTGGVGKTRLAQVVAGRSLSDFPDGVWLVEIAALTTPDQVIRAMLSALKVTETAGQESQESLIASLQGKRLLLVVDNCEHLIVPCAHLIVDLLAASPSVHVLATSREPLGLTGEQIYRVPSLAAPEVVESPAATAESVWRFEAVRLFVDRATLADSKFALTDHNASALARLCQQLDGIALALELAAARLRTLPLEQIVDRLEDRFHLLVGRDRTVLPRHQTLQSLIDWSYDLLSDTEKTFFIRLSVFAGGWTPEAAEFVCSGGGIENACALDLLTSLVDKSLVQRVEASGSSRYRMLETLRQYAGAKATASADAAMKSVRLRHRDYFVSIAEARLAVAEQERWLDHLEADRDNLWAVLDRCADAATRDPSDACGDAVVGLRLAGALSRFWSVRGYATEGRTHLTRALSVYESLPKGAHEVDTVLLKSVAKAYGSLGVLAASQGEYAAAKAYYEKSLSLWRTTGDKNGIASLLNSLGIVAFDQGDLAGARAWYEESLSLRRETGSQDGVAGTLNNLGAVACQQGDYETAQVLYEETLSIVREMGNKSWIARALNNLGVVSQSQKDYLTAQVRYEESLRLHRVMGDKRSIAASLNCLGSIACYREDYATALACYWESLTLDREIENKWGSAYGLEGLASVRYGEGNLHHALLLWAAADALRDCIGSPLPPISRIEQDEQIAQVKARLGQDVFAGVRSEGHRMSWEQAIRFALDEVVQGVRK